MEALFQAVNAICGKIQIVSNLFWDFPTNFDWYAKIPILGNFSLAIILLVGTGIYFTFRLRFIQVRKFRYGLHVLMRQKSSGTGISSLASFLLSTAMRVRKHPGCHRRDLHGRSGRAVLDVDLRVLRNVDGFRGGDALPDL